MPRVHIRKNDEVEVRSGKDRGKRGRVVNVLPRKGQVMVEGVARVQRHLPIRPTTRGGQQGGIITKELPVDLSNVSLICRNDGETRIGFQVGSDGVKVRVCKKCGAEL